MEAYVMFGVSTVTGLILSIFWKWVDGLKKSQEVDRKKIDELERSHADLQTSLHRDFQSKKDAHLDNERIITMLEGIKTDVNRLSDKLDKKADK